MGWNGQLEYVCYFFPGILIKQFQVKNAHFLLGQKASPNFFFRGFRIVSLGVVLKVTLFFLLSGKLTNIPWKIVVGSWKTILSFWKGPFLGDTISFFFQNNPFKGSTWYFCLWMVSSRDPTSMAVNVSNPMFGDKKVTVWMTWIEKCFAPATTSQSMPVDIDPGHGKCVLQISMGF